MILHFSSVLRVSLVLALAALPLASRAQSPSWVRIDHGLQASFENFNSVAFGNGVFVAIDGWLAGGKFNVATSANGETWATHSITTSFANSATGGPVRFTGEKFLVVFRGIVGSGVNARVTNLAMTSVDGTTWTEAGDINDSAGSIAESATFGARTIVAGGNGSLSTTTDFATWTKLTTPATGIFSYQDVAYGDGRWFLTTNGGGQVFTSTDGITFTAIEGFSASGGYRLEYGNGLWYAYSQTDIRTSTDGLTFTKRAIPALSSGYTSQVRFLNGRFIGPTGAGFAASTDAVTWTSFGNFPTIPDAFFISPTDLAYGNGHYVAVGAHRNRSGAYFAMILRAAADPVSTGPAITAHPQSQTVTAGGNITLTTAASGAGVTYQWSLNGTVLTNAAEASLALTNVQPEHAGLYTATATSAGASITSTAAIVGVSTTNKVIGSGTELEPVDIVHPNGNIFDQVLLTGPAEAITADHAQNQITRTSYIDLDNDIVQVEFSGPGTLSLVLDAPTGPAAPDNYNQAVNYMKGHAGIVITGATEHTNVSVFSVGKATAVNQALFKDTVTYDGIADIAFIAIASSNGKFGGVRTANAHYFAAKGLTGLYAPGVAFEGPVYLGDITAASTATPVLIIGSASDVRITGGNLDQDNDAAVEVDGLTQLKFTAGGDSHGNPLAAQTNAGVLKDNGVDVTAQVVVNP